MTPPTPLGPQTKFKAYVCAAALLSAVAGSILCLSSNVTRSPSPVASSAAGNSKLEARNSKSVGLDLSIAEPAARTRLVKNYGRLPLRFEANSGQSDSHVKFVSRGHGYTMFLTGDEAVLALRSQKSEARSQNGRLQPELGNWKLETGKSRLEDRNPKFEKRNAKSEDRGRGFHDLESGIFDLPSLLPRPKSSIQNPQSETNSPAPHTRRLEPAVLRMKLAGANPKAKVTGLDELPGKSNYFIGNDPKKWRTNVSNYAKVKYQGVYPGIDLVYYGAEGGQLEYDFVVAPGADPNSIAFEIGTGNSGLETRSPAPTPSARRKAGSSLISPPSPTGRGRPGGPGEGSPVRIDSNGDLVIPTDSGEVRFRKPLAYQVQSAVGSRQSAVNKPQLTTSAFNPKSKIENPKSPNPGPSNPHSSIANRQSVDGRFILLAENRVGFEVANYDRTLPLVLDPVLSYSAFPGMQAFALSFYEGDDGPGRQVPAIAVDGAGNTYSTGMVYPSPPDCGVYPLPSPDRACVDASVAKLNSTGTVLLYLTYLGGANPGLDYANSIVVGPEGNAYIAGPTESPDFPTTAGAFQTTPSSSATNPNAFVAELNPTGDGLVYSTLLGGSGSDQPNGIALDSGGNVYVVGCTSSLNDFPTRNAFQSIFPTTAGGKAFVSKLNSLGSDLVYSTFLGGAGGDCGWAIAVDSNGSAYVTGSTSSEDFPVTPGAYKLGLTSGLQDVFVTKLAATGSNLIYSTYLGNTGSDNVGKGIAIDSTGDAYVTGRTFGALFLTRLNADGSDLVFAAFLGGYEGRAVKVDSLGHAYVTGIPGTPFPILNAIQPVPNPYQYPPNYPSCFVAEFEPTGYTLVYSTYLGDSQTSCTGLALDADSSVYVAGTATDEGFPLTWDSLNEGGNVFVAKIANIDAPGFSIFPISASFGQTLVGQTNAFQQVFRLRNMGSAPLTTNFVTSGDFVSETSDCGSSVPPASTCAIITTFTPTAVGARAGSLTINDNAPGSPRTLSLSGTGYATTTVISPSQLSFGNQPVGTTSAAQAVTVTNHGPGIYGVISIAIPADFTQSNNCANVIVGDSCSFTISFAPTDVGGIAASLVITDNALDSPRSISLTGTGVQPKLSLSANTFTFGDQIVGTTSPAQRLTITNTGDGTLNIPGFGMSGDFEPTAFAAAVTQLAPGASHTVDITFVPTAIGTRIGTFTIYSDAPGSPHTVKLTGTGTDFVQIGGDNSSTVIAGGTAIYKLQIDPAGFVGNVTLGCAFQGATPQGAACSVSPSVVALNGTDPGPFTVNVATTARSLAVPRGPGLPPAPSPRYLLFLVLSIVLLAGVARLYERRRLFAGHRHALQWASLGTALLVVLLWTACGGGPTPTRQTGTPAGNYTLTLTASAGGVSRTTNLSLRVN